MVRRLLLICTGCILLTGCYMVPMAFIGPASSGFTTASLIQSGITTSASYVVKRSTGKSIGEHAVDILNRDIVQNSINKEILQQSYFPEKETTRFNGKR